MFLLQSIFFSNDFLTSSIALNFAVLGHCYSPWIKFKGGRGLATAAGGSLLLSPIIAIIWLISWFIIKKIVETFILLILEQL
ncbi:MAG: glycerol-3-phosphate acyltransferase [Ignavibacteriales bacterium]|nr:glycerol-3-phosphate acyltransferase [Ignavibacteriales bacterium]